jgi:hypothetical protein
MPHPELSPPLIFAGPNVYSQQPSYAGRVYAYRSLVWLPLYLVQRFAPTT